MRTVWCLLGLALLSCDSQSLDDEPVAAGGSDAAPSERPCPQELAPNASADGFVSTSGLEFESCGREYADRRAQCCGPRTAGYDCFVQALATCSPARFAEAHVTVEGDPIYYDYFVMPTEPDGCQVMVMIDNSQDGFRDPQGPPVSTEYCASVVPRLDSDDECPDLALQGCEP